MASPKNKWRRQAKKSEPLIPIDWWSYTIPTDRDWPYVAQEVRQAHFDTKIGNLYSVNQYNTPHYCYGTRRVPEKEKLHIFLGARVGCGLYTELTFYSVTESKKWEYTLYHAGIPLEWKLVSRVKDE